MIRTSLFTFGSAFAVGVTLHHACGSIAPVNGISMQPCLNPASSDTRDYLLLNKWSVKPYYHFKRGEIVCFYSPRNPDKCLVKRIVGLDGDLVRTPMCKDQATITVPEGHVWVEGDNRQHSLDSNYFGPLPKGLIIAKVPYVVWPPSRIKALRTSPEPKDRFLYMSTLHRTGVIADSDEDKT